MIRQEDGLVLWHIEGGHAVASGDWWTPAATRVDHIFDEFANDAYEQYGPVSGDTVVDCGAHVGMFTKLAVMRGAKRVYAFEPTPLTAAAWIKNIKDRAQNVPGQFCKLTEAAVWDCGNATMPLSIDPQDQAANSIVLERGVRGTAVKVLRLDSVIRARVDLIKMDIEGAEVHALHGAFGLINRWHPRLIVAAEHYADDVERITAAINGMLGIGHQYHMRIGYPRDGVAGTTLFFDWGGKR